MATIYPAPPAGAKLIYPPPEGPALPATLAAYNQWYRSVVLGENIKSQPGLI